MCPSLCARRNLPQKEEIGSISAARPPEQRLGNRSKEKRSQRSYGPFPTTERLSVAATNITNFLLETTTTKAFILTL